MRRLLLATAGAGVALIYMVAIAFGSSFTLKVRNNVHVTNAPTAAFAAKPVNKHEAVAVGSAGFAVYTFQGETSHHLICRKTSNQNTNCWAFWPPVSVSSPKGLSKQTGIRGHLGTVRRHGTLQVTLNGQPLYYFTPDLQSGNKHKATGDELHTYGSIWHIVVAGAGSAASSTPAASGTTTGTGSGSSNGGSTSTGAGGGYSSGW